VKYKRQSVRTGTSIALTRATGIATSAGKHGSAFRGPPVLIVPGYGMNASIFGYHPSGESLCDVLVRYGHDVWTCDLRGQGEARALAPEARNFGIAELALEDLPSVIDLVRSESGSQTVSLVGCSLGAALVFSFMAHHGDAKIHAVATMAGLVTWRAIHPLIRTLFLSSRLVAKVPMRGVRELAGFALPAMAQWAKPILSAYLNPETTDLRDRTRLIETVEDPSSGLNREIARWLRRKDLIVRGLNVSESLVNYTKPLFSVVALQDQIVPPETARHIFRTASSKTKVLIEVGTRDQPVAHADLFLGRGMQEQAFAPLAAFLRSA
jgi:pimeloyl-ACP methyl ester carboxylesterase